MGQSAEQPEVGSVTTDEGFAVGSQSSESRFNQSGKFSGGVELKRVCDNGDNVSENESDEEDKKSTGSADEVDDVQKTLQELLLSSQELELPEEQLRINDQAQEDELLAMESIYGDNMFSLDSQNGLQSFQIHIHVETLKGVSICVKLGSSTVLENEDDLHEFSYSFKVDYLPPIILTCVLPRSYPSHCPPYFTISVQWLHSAKISALCGILDSIWNEQSGQEVIYHCVEWLHSSCLPFLGFDHELTLGPYDGLHGGDKRAISGSISAELDVPLIKSYNDEQHNENFSLNLQECCICFSELPGTEFARLPCQHFFCLTCMKTYSEMHVKEGTVNKLLCPNAKCGGMIPPGLLGRLLDDDKYERWESMMLQKTLESMSDVMYCPRCETICITDGDEHAQCSKCFFSFCTICRDKWHVGAACITPEIKLLILMERQELAQLQEEQKKREKDLINEQLSLKLIENTAKRCPSCEIYISRIDGCNKMECRNCRTLFCYSCNFRIWGYEHFREGGCTLFPTVDPLARLHILERWQMRINARRVREEMQARNRGGDGDGRPCPVCRRRSPKVDNNNYIFCRGCGNHFCGSCSKVVRSFSRHYGPKRCKQHTIGG